MRRIEIFEQNTPSPLLPQSSVQIKEGIFLGAYGTSKPKKFVYSCTTTITGIDTQLKLQQQL